MNIRSRQHPWDVRVSAAPSAISNRPKPGEPGSKIGPVSVNRNVATVSMPATDTGHSEYRIQVLTYLTRVPTQGEGTFILYNGDRMWSKVTVTLETAGPVSVGEAADLQPVLSGKGQVLRTGVPATFNIAKGNKLYIAANTVNRVSLVVEAEPWLESIQGLLSSINGLVTRLALK